MNYIIRTLYPSEYFLLEEFLYQAIFVPKGQQPPPRSVLQSPALRVYVDGFGQSPHDRAFAAVAEGRVAGAVWVRIMDDYGHVDSETPSFALSLLPEFRGQGLGTALLHAMLDQLRQAGYAQASLAVQKDNYAARMYQRAGFQILRETEEEFIMVCPLSERK
ncbi:N-acetyltransferase family protein [Acutalibacter sp.]|jgi:ribosomal protein S18 acetylase RimI-like enzyme|uniref:GNAT family N-acetyltransferase n=1 Tax=Acutalibacter sp. TaxID=1918636 RepID=UPI0021732C97|nr:GNAT family N-acetyltransferase [Acutalibacter sp.]